MRFNLQSTRPVPPTPTIVNHPPRRHFHLQGVMDQTPIDVECNENDETPTTKKRSGRIFDVWEHFTKVKDGNPKNPRRACNYCGKDYACDSRRELAQVVYGCI